MEYFCGYFVGISVILIGPVFSVYPDDGRWCLGYPGRPHATAWAEMVVNERYINNLNNSLPVKTCLRKPVKLAQTTILSQPRPLRRGHWAGRIEALRLHVQVLPVIYDFFLPDNIHLGTNHLKQVIAESDTRVFRWTADHWVELTASPPVVSRETTETTLHLGSNLRCHRFWVSWVLRLSVALLVSVMFFVCDDFNFHKVKFMNNATRQKTTSLFKR